MRKVILILALFSILIIAGCFKAAPVLLEYKATEGDPPRYEVSFENKLSVEGEGEEAKQAEEALKRMGIKIDMTVKQESKSIKEGLEQTMIIESGKIVESKGGDEEEIDEGEKIEMAIKKNGEVLEAFSDVPGLTPMVIFSDNPVAPGDTWTNKFEFAAAERLEEFEVEGKYTLKKFQTVNGLKCAVIMFEVPETKIDIKRAEAKFSSQGTMTFAYEKGYILNFDVKRNIAIEDESSDVVVNMDQKLTMKNI